MFIQIGEKFCKHARWFFIVFAIATGGSLIGFFTTTSGSNNRRSNSDLPTIHGKPIDQGAYESALSLVQAQYLVLQGKEIRRSLANNEQLKQEAVVQMLMDRKAREMGLRVTDEELAHQIQSLPILQNQAGRFEPGLGLWVSEALRQNTTRES